MDEHPAFMDEHPIFITMRLYNLCSPIFSAVVLQESVEDLDLRCLELLQLLRDLPQRHLAVVSHTGGDCLVFGDPK